MSVSLVVAHWWHSGRAEPSTEVHGLTLGINRLQKKRKSIEAEAGASRFRLSFSVFWVDRPAESKARVVVFISNYFKPVFAGFALLRP